MFAKSLVLGAMFLFGTVASVTPDQAPEIVRVPTLDERYMDLPLTKKNLARAIVDAGIQHPDVVYRQALLESRHLKSGLCRDGNNLFGMKRPRSRETYALKKTIYGHAAFSHWIYSVMDYKLWQGDKPITNYFRFLKRRNYAANPRYISLLKGIFIKENIRNILTNA